MTTKMLLPLLFLFCLAAYSSSFSKEFVWDDIPQIAENPYIKDLSNTPLFFTNGVWALSRMQESREPYYRPLFLLSIALDYKAWALNPLGYRITNILLHFLVVLFVYLIACMVLADRTAALVAAAIFALYPANTEVVAWISGRTDMIAALFLLPAFFFHNKRQFHFSLLFFACALLSKETSVVLPLLTISFGIIHGKKPRELAKETIPYLIVILAYFVIRRLAIDSAGLGLVFTPEKFFLLLKAVLHYLRVLVLPWPLPFLPNDVAPRTLVIDIIGTTAFGGMLAAFFKINRKAASFLLFWIIVFLMPPLAAQFNPLFNSFAYRFLYFPSIGYAIIVGALAANMLSKSRPARKMVLSAAVILLLLLYGSLIYIRGFYWRSTAALWEYSLSYFPDSAIAHNAMASLEPDKEKALYHFKMAETLNPGVGNNDIGLGTLYGMQGKYDLAEAYLVKGIVRASTKVGKAVGYNSLGNVYYFQGKIPEATKQYRNAVEIDSMNAEANYNLAMALKTAGMTEESMVYMKRYQALTVNGADTTAPRK